MNAQMDVMLVKHSRLMVSCRNENLCFQATQPQLSKGNVQK